MLEDEDFALEELDDFAELLLDLALLLNLAPEEDDFTELLDASSQSSQTLEDESSEGRVEKPLSSSPQAATIKANIKAKEKCFILLSNFLVKIQK